MLQIEEERHWSEMCVVGDVRPPADDGNTFQSGKRNGQGDANIRANPQKTPGDKKGIELSLKFLHHLRMISILTLTPWVQ